MHFRWVHQNGRSAAGRQVKISHAMVSWWAPACTMKRLLAPICSTNVIRQGIVACRRGVRNQSKSSGRTPKVSLPCNRSRFLVRRSPAGRSPSNGNTQRNPSAVTVSSSPLPLRHLARHKVHGRAAQKAGDKVVRQIIDLQRRPHLLHHPFVHDDDKRSLMVVVGLVSR